MSDSPSTLDSPAIHVTDGAVLGARTTELARQMRAGVGEPDPDDPSTDLGTEHRLSLDREGSGAVGGLRTYVSDDLGRGYWDFIEVAPGFYTSITDAVYQRGLRMWLPAERLVKIRVMCSGSIRMATSGSVLAGGAAVVQLFGGGDPTEYFVESDEPLRMVVLHLLPESLGPLGVTRASLPADMRILVEDHSTPDFDFPLEASAMLVRIAREIVESRDRLLSELRQTYVRGKARELLCEVLLRLRPLSDTRAGHNRYRQRDIVRLHEARRILASCLEDPPTIDQLSRMVAINRTKLKAGFREFFGETIQQYRTRVRLEEAVRLIEETELSMGEISRRVGFSHPSNFSQLMKRHFGVPPLELRRSSVPLASLR